VCVLLENSTLENQYELLDQMLWPISGSFSPSHTGRVHSSLGNTQFPSAVRVANQKLYFNAPFFFYKFRNVLFQPALY
jgi:hypothetical protein